MDTLYLPQQWIFQWGYLSSNVPYRVRAPYQQFESSSSGYPSNILETWLGHLYNISDPSVTLFVELRRIFTSSDKLCRAFWAPSLPPKSIDLYQNFRTSLSRCRSRPTVIFLCRASENSSKIFKVRRTPSIFSKFCWVLTNLLLDLVSSFKIWGAPYLPFFFYRISRWFIKTTVLARFRFCDGIHMLTFCRESDAFENRPAHYFR